MSLILQNPELISKALSVLIEAGYGPYNTLDEIASDNRCLDKFKKTK